MVEQIFQERFKSMKKMVVCALILLGMTATAKDPASPNLIALFDW